MPDELKLVAALFGLLIGSFLNVCIYRWPRDLSVVRPRSRCPECEAPIAAFDNIPVLSYFLLRGRCRHCRAPISARYPAVELMTALIFALLVWRFGPTPTTLRYCVLIAMLIVLGFADVETRLLPDEFTIGGMLAGFAFRVLCRGAGYHRACDRGDFRMAARAARAFPGRSVAGSGDSRRLALAGRSALRESPAQRRPGLWRCQDDGHDRSFLGLKGALLTLIAGSVLGSVVGLLYLAITRKDAATYQLPLGTFLAIGGVFTALFGQQVIHWYASTIVASAFYVLAWRSWSVFSVCSSNTSRTLMRQRGGREWLAEKCSERSTFAICWSAVSVYPDMYSTDISIRFRCNLRATSRPFISGMTRSVTSR